MKKIIHLSLWKLKQKDKSACGVDLALADYIIGASVDKRDVTCKNCKRSKIYKESK